MTVGFGADQDRFGPEFPFGIYLEKLVGEPILLIKTSWGGKSLHTDFRPPTAGPFEWGDYELRACKNRGHLEKDRADKIKATGVYYRLMLEHVWKVLGDMKRVVPDYDPSQGYEIAGYVWFQGFNDLVSTWTYPDHNKPGGYDLYSVPVLSTAGAFYPRSAQGSFGPEDAIRDWSYGTQWPEAAAGRVIFPPGPGGAGGAS